MSDTGGTCEYVLDPDDPETWGGEEGDECYVEKEVLNEDGVWSCPHDAENGESLCIFHLPVEEKDDEAVVYDFLDVIESDDGQSTEQLTKNQFIACEFGKFDLSGTELCNENHEGPIYFTNSKFLGKVLLKNSVIEPDIRFSSVVFEQEVKFLQAELRGDAKFFNSKFLSTTSFRKAQLHKNSDFSKARFEDVAIFRRTKFQGFADFLGAEFRSDGSFQIADFNDDVSFRNVVFSSDADFHSANFASDTDFIATKFQSGIDFHFVEFGNSTNIGRCDLSSANFNNADLTDVDLSGANLSCANLESARLNRATLFDADLRGAKLSGTLLGDVRVNDNTYFLGHPSNDSDTSPHTFSAIRSRTTCVYDPDYEEDNEREDVDKAKSVYRALEELSGKHARPRLQARSFVRRQDLQKDEYKQDAKQADSLEERLIAGARYSRAKVARATLLYGESPWRVIAWSLGIIFSFALLYPLGGWMKPADGDPITYAQIASNPVEILNSVYYSTLTYTALGFGDFQPVGFGRLLTTVETGLGAVMLALLVFILGRRAAR